MIKYIPYRINITPKNVNNIICNIIIKSNDNYLWSDLIIKHYNANFNNVKHGDLTTFKIKGRSIFLLKPSLQ